MQCHIPRKCNTGEICRRCFLPPFKENRQVIKPYNIRVSGVDALGAELFEVMLGEFSEHDGGFLTMP